MGCGASQPTQTIAVTAAVPPQVKDIKPATKAAPTHDEVQPITKLEEFSEYEVKKSNESIFRQYLYSCGFSQPFQSSKTTQIVSC